MLQQQQTQNWAREKLTRFFTPAEHGSSIHNSVFLVIHCTVSRWREKLLRNKITKNESTIIFYFSVDFCFHRRFIFDSFSLFRFAQLEYFVALALRPHPNTVVMLFLYRHDLSHHVISLFEYVVATNVDWLEFFALISPHLDPIVSGAGGCLDLTSLNYWLSTSLNLISS